MTTRFPVSIPFLKCLSLFAGLIGAIEANPKKSAAMQKPSGPNPTETVIYMPSRPKPLLDSSTIRKYYLDGEFEPAIEILEIGLREKRPYTHDDSVFIFKHLGVMYAAKYETRERGKYFMHQLLMTEPTARIMDMYASDMIYMIFKNIQDELESTRYKMERAESHVTGNTKATQKSPSGGESENNGDSKSGFKPFYWVGAGVVTAGVAAYFLLAEAPKSITTTNKHTVP
jgi:hypothetical protein